MFAKIQKYLLLNHPLLWNTKIVPMGLTILGFNLLFFILGYFSGSINFNNPYDADDSHVIFTLAIILTSILILIIWLIYYLKNNAFKSFYPKKSFSLYWEWLAIFILISGNVFYYFSYTQGVQCRIRTYASPLETQKALRILNMVDILLPESDRNYYKRTNSTAPKDSVSVSILNFNNYSLNKEKQQVLNWLKSEKKDSIRAVMTEYMNLQKKYGLKTNLTVDSWMKLIYNPPNFAVSPANYISHNSPHSTSPYPYTANIDISSNPEFYVEYNNLDRGYDIIHDAYNLGETIKNTGLISLYISLFLSLFLFSFRISSGKSWLIGLVCVGLLCFINGIIAAVSGIILDIGGNDLLSLSIGFWTLIFVGSAIYLFNKVIQTDSKGKSYIILNIFLWLIPIIPMIYYNQYMNSYNYNHTGLFYCFEENPTLFFWINLIFVLLILFFLMKTLKRWRALPEE